MNPKEAVGLVFVAILALSLVIGLVYLAISRNAGIRRKEYHAMLDERDVVLDALYSIEKECDDNPGDMFVIGTLRPIIRDYKEKRRALRI